MLLDIDYYTPNKEDLFIGYEYQYLTNGDDWISHILYSGQDIKEATEDILEQKIRTSYLTKEQLQKEGWSGETTMVKDELNLNFNNGISSRNRNIGNGDIRKIDERDYITSLRIFIPSKRYTGTYESELFIGKCPSINEFRKIIKLISHASGL